MTALPRRDCHAAHFERNDLWILVLGYVRYALGRRSTAPSLAASFVLRYRRHLTSAELAQIVEEVRWGLDRETDRPGYLGDPCDVATWRGLIADLERA